MIGADSRASLVGGDGHFRIVSDQPPPQGVDVLGFIVGDYDSSGIGHLKLLYLPSGRIVDGASPRGSGKARERQTA